MTYHEAVSFAAIAIYAGNNTHPDRILFKLPQECIDMAENIANELRIRGHLDFFDKDAKPVVLTRNGPIGTGAVDNATIDNATDDIDMSYVWKMKPFTQEQHLQYAEKLLAWGDVANLRRLYLHCKLVGHSEAEAYCCLLIERLEKARAGESI